jgi:drug/metabolite transporter (DMT)-like permease
LSATVGALVLFAALLHATWNSLLKIGGDRAAVMAVLQLTGAFPALIAVTQLPMLEMAAAPYLLASIVLHNIYYFLLIAAYGHGDYGQVYPIARGSAPLLVSLAAVPLAGEAFGLWGWAGVVLITCGIVSLAFRRGLPWRESATPVLFALATGLAISSYSVVDGLGARLNGSAHGYAAWLFAFEWFPIMGYVVWRNGAAVGAVLRASWASGAVAGLLAVAGYWIVIWAMSQAPLGLVVSLRETSVVFAALISMALLREGFGKRRLAAAIVVAAGVILLKLTS